jgi:EmrB/QacA subfamily drug resistance transporter
LTGRGGTEGYHEAPLEAANRRELTLVVGALFVTTLLAALDQTIFATALPTIVGDLNGVGQMLWVTTAYLLAATVTMPVYGKFGDLLGHKPLLLVALALFLAGSVLGGLAGSMPVLIAARAVQGLGGGGMMILSQAIIADIIPPRRRGTYLGILGGAWAFSSVLGPILGGWFVDTIGWRWAFWFNLPLGILAVVAASVFLKTPARRKEAPRIDGAGMATLAVVTTAIIFVASLGGRQYAWGSPIVLGLAALAIVGSALFVVVERRAAEPIVPLSLFRDRNFDLVTAAGLLSSIAFLGVIIYMPSYLQMVSGLSATKSGLLLVALTAGILISSVGSGVRVSRTGRYRWMPAAGAFVTAVSLYLLSTLTMDTELWVICLYLFVCGLGTGIGFQILIVMVQNSFPISMVGTATGAHNFFRQIGATLGSAIVGTLFASRLLNLLGERLGAIGAGSAGAVDPNSLTPASVAQMSDPLKTAIISSYNDALTPIYLYLVPMMAVAFVLLLFVREKPLAVTNEEGPQQDAGASMYELVGQRPER